MFIRCDTICLVRFETFKFNRKLEYNATNSITQTALLNFEVISTVKYHIIEWNHIWSGMISTFFLLMSFFFEFKFKEILISYLFVYC